MCLRKLPQCFDLREDVPCLCACLRMCMWALSSMINAAQHTGLQPRIKCDECFTAMREHIHQRLTYKIVVISMWVWMDRNYTIKTLLTVCAYVKFSLLGSTKKHHCCQNLQREWKMLSLTVNCVCVSSIFHKLMGLSFTSSIQRLGLPFHIRLIFPQCFSKWIWFAVSHYYWHSFIFLNILKNIWQYKWKWSNYVINYMI